MTPRDNMHRCPICKKLFKDEDCIENEQTGLQCPNLCEPVFEQPPYQSPLHDE